MRKLNNLLQELEESLVILSKAEKEIPNRIKQLEQDIVAYDAERQDLLHYAEHVNFNAAEGYIRFKELQVVSQKRRQAKTELEDLMSLQDKLNKRLFEGNRIGSTMKTIEHRKTCRTKFSYAAKVRNDLQDRMNYSFTKRERT
ncbi:hypothetical protein M3649_03780 [Ureibacillus chungkukjangi]|uniref:hypothetical protein n=1 Tax=Ureibacillus chungkukjangi TaxID=1202712 RepID=UPI00203CB8A7|nr:hypothetical protein [Ureibacillus chungkukjangi]MCM3387251.1 hypothetical protein [Ureibacillus chungkukjangi]